MFPRLSLRRNLATGRAVPRVSALLGLSLVVLLAATARCGDEPWGLISTAQEVQFGAEAHRELLAEYPRCTACDSIVIAGSNYTVTQYVTRLGQDMAYIGNPDRGVADDQIPSWTFTVVDSDEINAFAIPGGFVYVTTSLLGIMDNKAELAGVLGHEVGHVTGYHGVKRIEQFMVVNNLSSLIFGADSSLTEWANIFVAGYDNFVSSKDDERDADERGVRYSYEDGYNPLNLNRFFEYIQPMVGTDAISTILSTHPAPSERIANVQRHAKALGVTSLNAPSLIADDPDVPYASVRNAVAGRASALTLARSGGNFARLPAWVQALTHACRFDPASRELHAVQ